MGLFKSKAEKEQERKMAVKQAVRDLEKRIEKLKEAEAKYIKMAEIAINEDLPQMLENVKSNIQITRSERKRTYSMLIQTQMLAQMKEMTDSTGEFFNTVRNISKAVAGTSVADMRKITADLQKAMDNIEQTNEVLTNVIEETNDAVGDLATNTALESSDKVDDAIYSRLGIKNLDKNTVRSEDMDFNSEIADLQKMLGK
jgi:methionine synthase II (cobalamin-independent)